jgi:hypothetical protein
MSIGQPQFRLALLARPGTHQLFVYPMLVTPVLIMRGNTL